MLYKKPTKVRKASQRGKEVTIDPKVPLEVGQEVVQIFDGFVLYVPKDAKVNEKLLVRAIKTKGG